MKNNMIKRVTMALLACVMLMVTAIPANANSAGAAATENHQHHYKMEYLYYNSYTLGTHKFYKTLPTGEVVEDTCYMVAYMYNGIRYTCTEAGCSDTYTVNTSGREIRHMQCGAANEYN